MYSIVSMTSEALAARFRPAGSEFQVNTYGSITQQYAADIAMTNSQFLIVWHTFDPIPTNGVTIRGQRHDLLGQRVSEEFLVSSGATSDDKEDQKPVVGASPDGSFVVAWESYLLGDPSTIQAQRLDSIGLPVGAQFMVNQSSNYGQQDPSLAVGPDGRFVILWTEHNRFENEVYHLFARAQVFSKDGARLGAEITISDTIGASSHPVATFQSAEQFVAVWQHNQHGESGLEVLGQRFEVDGKRIGSEFRVNSHTEGNQQRPDIASLPDGGFVVAWQSSGQDGSGLGIRGRRFDSSAIPRAASFAINSYTTNHQALPSIGSDSDGGFVVAWESYDVPTGGSLGQDGDGRGVFAQRFEVDGTRDGAEFQVNTFTIGNQGRFRAPEIDVAVQPDGDFIIAWLSSEPDGRRGNIFSQRYELGFEIPSCGDPTKSGFYEATDALTILRAAIDLIQCDVCLCDIDNSGAVTGVDALASLRGVVGLDVVLACPECE